MVIKAGIIAAVALALVVVAYLLLNGGQGAGPAAPSGAKATTAPSTVPRSTAATTAATTAASTTVQGHGYNSSSNSSGDYAAAYAACASAGVSYSDCPAYCRSDPAACGSPGARPGFNSTVASAGDGTPTTAGNLASCPPGNAFLTRSPINATQLSSIEPLGHVAGPHVLPNQADHVYLYAVSAPDGTALLTPVYSPGNVTLLQVAVAKSGNKYEPATSYVVFFSNCRSMMYGFQLPRISTAVQDYIGSLRPYSCSNSSLQSICVYANLSMGLKAGDLIGWTGIHSPNSTGVKDDNSVDFAAADVRTKAWPFIDMRASTGFLADSYLHAVCPLDYFSASGMAYLYGKLSSRNSTANGIPACGSTFQDLSGTAQGNWYRRGSQPQNGGVNISASLTVAHINADPAFGVISAGSALLPTSNIGAQMAFRPQQAGQINREPSQVAQDGKVYCYQGGVGYGVLYLNGTVNMDNGPLGHVDIRLDNATALEADYATGPCAAAPALTNPVIYVR